MDFVTLDATCRERGIAPFGSLVEDEYRRTFDHPTNLQVNVGYKCNLACTHCFLECSPASTEYMDRETMEAVLRLRGEKHGFESRGHHREGAGGRLDRLRRDAVAARA